MAINQDEERFCLEVLNMVAEETSFQFNFEINAKPGGNDVLLQYMRDMLKSLDTKTGHVPSMTSILCLESVDRQPVQAQIKADSAKKVAPLGNQSARKRSRKNSARQKK